MVSSNPVNNDDGLASTYNVEARQLLKHLDEALQTPDPLPRRINFLRNALTEKLDGILQKKPALEV